MIEVCKIIYRPNYCDTGSVKLNFNPVSTARSGKFKLQKDVSL